jgi:hypothetical protein
MKWAILRFLRLAKPVGSVVVTNLDFSEYLPGIKSGKYTVVKNKPEWNQNVGQYMESRTVTMWTIGICHAADLC